MISLPSRKAFTLVEVLVSLLIIALLTIILLPVVSKVSGKAGQVKCLNNLRQVAASLSAFVVENRGHYPNCYKVEMKGLPPVLTYDIAFWGGRLFQQGYVSDPDIFFCPSAKVKYWKDPTFAAGLRGHQGDSAWAYVSYGANRYGLMPAYSDGLVPAQRANLANPSRTVLLIEVSNPQDPRSYDGLEWLSSASAAAVGAIMREGGATDAAGPSRRHGRSVNVAFADGHVEMMDLAHSSISSFQSYESEPWYEFVYTIPNP